MHYRVRYSLDFDLKIHSGQVWQPTGMTPMRTTGNNDCWMGGEKTRVTGPIQINFEQILGEVETTTSKIHVWISAQPVIEDNQGAKYMYIRVHISNLV